MTNKRIYIASKTKHAEKWKELRSMGYRIVSTWIDESGEGQTKDYSELADRCVNEVAMSDILILYVEDSEQLKGALIELGVALIRGTTVYIVADESRVSLRNTIGTTFYHHPCVKGIFKDLDSCFNKMNKL